MIDELIVDLKKLKQDRMSSFNEAARRLAKGQKMKPLEVEEILRETGKSPEALEAAVELASRRMVWATDLAAAQNCDAEIAELDRQGADLQAALDKAQETFDKKAWPLDSRRIEIEGRRASAVAAERQLRDSCSEEIKLAIEQSRRIGSEIGSRVAAIRKESKRLETAVSDMKQAEAFGQDSPKGRQWLETAKANKQAGERAIAELPKVEAELVAAEREVKELEARMLSA